MEKIIKRQPWTPIGKSCEICGKIFICESRFRFNHGKFCSKDCLGKANGKRKMGKIAYIMTKKIREKISKSIKNNPYKRVMPLLSGEKHWKWKGESVEYRALHSWVNRNYVKKGWCALCGASKNTKDGREYTQLSNISHEYKRDINDYIELCPSCNVNYDYGHISKETILNLICGPKEDIRLA